MINKNFEKSKAWRASDLKDNLGWIFSLDERVKDRLYLTIKQTFNPERPLFSYCREEFDFGPAWEILSAAISEAHNGCGLALVRGLPREGLTEKEFEMLNWALGLHVGVARPQGRAEGAQPAQPAAGARGVVS